MRSSAAAPALLLALALTGCGAGDDTSGRAADPAPTSSGSAGAAPERTAPAPTVPTVPTETPTEAGALVSIVTETAVGGTVSPEAVPVGDEASLQAFAEQFDDPRMLDRLTRAVQQAEVSADQVLLAATVAIGCDVPGAVDVTVTSSGVQVVAAATAGAPQQECLAAMTSVALVTADPPA